MWFSLQFNCADTSVCFRGSVAQGRLYSNRQYNPQTNGTVVYEMWHAIPRPHGGDSQAIDTRTHTLRNSHSHTVHYIAVHITHCTHILPVWGVQLKNICKKATGTLMEFQLVVDSFALKNQQNPSRLKLTMQEHRTKVIFWENTKVIAELFWYDTQGRLCVSTEVPTIPQRE